jgi:hypothetical protein
MNKFRLLCAAAAIAAPTAAYAQETTATIRGSVTNAGAAVPGAEVVVENTETGQRATGSTNQEGAFVFTGLRAGGPYRVTVTAPGAAPNAVEDIFLSAGDPFRLPIDIAAASPEETAIVVTGQRVGGQSLSPTTTLRRDDIEGVATVSRDVRDLIRRSPFAQLDPTNSRATSIAGQNPRFNRFSVNGVQFSDDFGLNNGGLPTSRGPVPLDAICQFSVEVAPVDIREGDFQGGAINAQLCGGSNTPTGGAFYTYNDQNLIGDSIDGEPRPQPEQRNEAYGAYLRGPIIRDTLFFAVAWERTRETEPSLFGPTGAGFANSVPGVTQATVAEIQNIAQSLYGFDAGGVPQSVLENDDRVTARIDWNINENHDLALTYIYNNGSQAIDASSSTSLGAPRLGLFSNSYTLTETVHSGVAQLNSRWSDMFSTEARISYRDYVRGQTPPNGREFGQFTVCLDPVNVGSLTGCTTGTTAAPNGTATVVFGPDISRQANDLNSENLDVQLTGNLLVGNHSIRFLAQHTDADTYNLFLQRASGAFYFDSLNDFRNGRASQLDIAQSTTGDINGAAAIFDYQTYVLGVQDTWDVFDNLTIVAGLRYEWFDQGTPPALNNFFTNRYGFSNQENLNGRDILLPRFGISWRPTQRMNVRGTFGRYAAGTPDVFISNSYSNTGVTQNRLTINRTAAAPGCTGFGAPAGQPAIPIAQQTALCNAALVNVFGGGPGIPASVLNFVQNDPRALAQAGVNAIDPEFQVPNQYRAAATLSYNADLGFLGDNWFFAVDGLYSWVDKALDYVDLRSVPIGTAPDGRPRYGAFAGTQGNNSDLLLTNSDQGDALFLVARVQKEFENGFDFSLSYTYAEVNERSPITSSVAFSNYANQPTANPNGSSLGTGNEQIDYAVKLNLGYRREFFRDAETRIQLFAEVRQGRPFSYTFDANPTNASGRDPTFGVFGNDNRHLIYVPNGPTDPLVIYDSPATQAGLDEFINRTQLADFRGGIAGKNIGRSDEYVKVDLHVSQDIPLPARLGRVQLFADMENVLNFINDEWGVLRQFGFPYTATVVDVTCVAAPAGAPANPCAQYRYSNFRDPAIGTNTGASLWALRVGARFEF